MWSSSAHASTPEELFAPAWNCPLKAEPGTRAEYSDPGFILLGKALEVLIREDLGDWARREVFQPLGHGGHRILPCRRRRAADSADRRRHTLRHRRIQGEVQDENAWVLKGVAGHAGLFSNVPDLLRFAGEILGERQQQPASEQVRPLFTQRPSSALPSGKRRRAVRARWAGIRHRKTLRPASTSRRIPSAIWATAAARFGSIWTRRRCRLAHQSHLAGSEEPVDPRGAPGFSRRCAREHLSAQALELRGYESRAFGMNRILLDLRDLQIQSEAGDRRDANQHDDAGDGRHPGKKNQRRPGLPASATDH